MQRGMRRRGLRQPNTAGKYYIGFKIFKINENAKLPLDMDYINEQTPVANSGLYTPLRDVVVEFKLDPGRYVVIPSTYDPNKEGKFLLRIIAEKNTAKAFEA